MLLVIFLKSLVSIAKSVQFQDVTPNTHKMKSQLRKTDILHEVKNILDHEHITKCRIE